MDVTARQMATGLRRTLREHFPSLMEQLETLPDVRARKGYSAAELVMGAVSMFLFQDGSRNRANQNRSEPCFGENYARLFGMDMPHLDTVTDFLRTLEVEALEKVKAALTGALIRATSFQGRPAPGALPHGCGRCQWNR